MKRILGLALGSGQIGYVLKEDGHDMLLDYGVKEIKSSQQPSALKTLQLLYDKFQPDFICIQDIYDSESRLGTKQRQSIKAIEAWLAAQDVSLKAVSKSDTRHTFDLSDTATKHDVCMALLQSYPDLKILGYKKSKIWESKNRAGLCLTALALIETLP